MNRNEITQCMRDGCTLEQTYKINEYIDNLEQEIQRLKENNLAMQGEMAKTWEKLQQRDSIIEEAINLIKKYCVIFEGMEDYPIDLHYEQVKDLLEILNKYKDDNLSGINKISPKSDENDRISKGDKK